MRTRLVGLLGLGLLWGCGNPSPSGQALRVEITWEPAVTSPCFVLRVDADGRSTIESQPLVSAGRSSLEVGVFQADLPSDITLRVVGFDDAACTVESNPPQTSPSTPAHFGSGVTTVALRVLAPGVGAADGGDDGGTPDSGTPDSGTPDSGTPDSGTPDSGTPDSGTPDSGTPDSGTPDSGTPDSGTPDAGMPENCSNGVDDNGNGLADCADPACPTGVVCNDNNLCTQNDYCDAGVCQGTNYLCAGPIAACYVPAGCDAGVCLATPTAARTFCDGGQCDGAGRCAPFCDPTAATLVACYTFEGTLSDGSAFNNSGNAAAGTFGPGSRGQAYTPGVTAVIVGDHPSLDCTTGLTLEAWVKLTAWPDAGLRYGVLDNDGQYGLFIGPGGELRCSTGIASAVPGVVTLNTWHHLGCTFDGPARTARSYVDGVQVALLDSGLADGGTATLSQGNDAGLWLGQNSPSGDVLQGAIDGIRIWCEPRAPIDFCTVLGECG